MVLALALVPAACSGGAPTAEPAEPVPTRASERAPDPVSVPAPIREVTVRKLGDPPRHVAVVVSVQPDSCEEFEGFATSISGTVVSVEVTNLRTAGGQAACTGPERETRTEVPLGPDLSPGETYTVDVNGTAAVFVAGPPEPTEVADAASDPEPTPVGHVRAMRVTVLLDDAGAGLEAVFQALVLDRSDGPAAGVTVQASLQGPVGTQMLRSMVGEARTDEGGIAEFRFGVEHAGTYLFLVELAFGLGAILDRDGSGALHAFLEVPPQQGEQP